MFEVWWTEVGGGRKDFSMLQVLLVVTQIWQSAIKKSVDSEFRILHGFFEKIFGLQIADSDSYFYINIKILAISTVN